MAPRDKGMGWNISKVHEIKHVGFDTGRWGAPGNTSTAPTEHHHIEHAKNPSKTCRKERSTWDMSLANRYVDNLIIDIGCAAFEVEPAVSTSNETVVTSTNEIKVTDKGSTRFTLYFESSNGNENNFTCHQDWQISKLAKLKGHTYLKDGVVNAIGEFVEANTIPTGCTMAVKCFTEHNRDNVKFRAHPNYQQDGPWNDWIYIQWEDHGSLPARIEAFFYQEGTPYAVIHSVARTPEQYSVLVRFSVLEFTGDVDQQQPFYSVVECSCFRHHTYVFPKSFSDNEIGVLELLPYDMWGDKFTHIGNDHVNEFMADIYED